MKIILDETWPRDAATRALLDAMRVHLADRAATLVLIATETPLSLDGATVMLESASELLGPPREPLALDDAALLIADASMRSVADAFMTFFSSPSARFFTNGATPLTRSKRDHGVFAIDGTRLGVLWFED